MRILSLLLVFLFLSSCKSAREDSSSTNLVVNPAEVENVMTFLTSDELMGRNTGTDGIEQAARFIEKGFQENGVKPYFETYRDNFTFNDLEAFNVVGYVEGSDPKLKDEFIIVGAHYDHVGIIKPVENDSIANGANDNATGTVATMLLAHHFGRTKANKRSMLFVLFSAEEMGLQGSKHLAKKLKSQELDLYTVLNFEMIGVPFTDRDYTVFMSGFDLSNMAGKMNEYVDKNLVGFSEVSKKYNLFKRSDNYPFFQEFNIPAHSISSCDLTNYEYYHHVDDEVEKQNFEHMAGLIEQLKPALEKMANTPIKEIKMN